MNVEFGTASVELRVTDAPRVSGFTSGLAIAEVEPREISLWYHSGKCRVKVTGLKVRKDGSVGEVWVTVTVSEDIDFRPLTLPDWLDEVVEAQRPRLAAGKSLDNQSIV